jgi:hypothetical protein
MTIVFHPAFILILIIDECVSLLVHNGSRLKMSRSLPGGVPFNEMSRCDKIRKQDEKKGKTMDTHLG